MSDKLLWHDPNIESGMNRQYIFQFSQAGFDAVQCGNVDQAVQRLRSEREGSRWVVITSGTDGETLVQQIQGLACVVEVLVFCRSVEFHQGWAKKYPKVTHVLSAVGAVKKTIKHVRQSRALAVVLSSIPQNSAAQILATAFRQREVQGDAEFKFMVESTDGGSKTCACAIAFMIIVNRAQRKINADTDIAAREVIVAAELRKLVRADELTDFNKQWDGPWHRDNSAGSPQRVEGPSLAQKLSLTYTSDFVYYNLNRKVANFQKIGEVMNYVTTFFQALKSETTSVQHDGAELLFRGIPSRYLNDADYAVSKTLIFPPFISTSKSLQTAITFSEAEVFGEGYVLRVTRLEDRGNRHPTIDYNLPVTAHWGHFGTAEKEVLWFPFSSFKVTNREETQVEINGERATVKVIHLQELDSIFHTSQSQIETFMGEWLRGIQTRTRRALQGDENFQWLRGRLAQYIDPDSSEAQNLVRALRQAPEWTDLNLFRMHIADLFAEYCLDQVGSRIDVVMGPQFQALLVDRFQPVRDAIKERFLNDTAGLWCLPAFRPPMRAEDMEEAARQWYTSSGMAREDEGHLAYLGAKDIIAGSWPQCVEGIMEDMEKAFNTEFEMSARSSPADDADLQSIFQALGERVDMATIAKRYMACDEDSDKTVQSLLQIAEGGEAGFQHILKILDSDVDEGIVRELYNSCDQNVRKTLALCEPTGSRNTYRTVA